MADLLGSWPQRLARDRRRVIILDDDPTGTQTVANVEVILQPEREAYRHFFAQSERAIYILTNTRALPREEAVARVKQIRAEVSAVAQEYGCEVAFVLRGDSTLRGHIFAEMEALAGSAHDWVGLFVPAFPEAGRITLDGIHYLVVDGKRVPMAQTEFARDGIFGYQSERLNDWVAEVGAGHEAILLPLAQLRAAGPALVHQTLLAAPPGAIVIPDAETRADLELVAWGLLDAEEALRAADSPRRQIVVRSASSFAAVRAGLHGQSIRSLGQNDYRLLVVCGSHTQASSAQLVRLIERTLSPVVIPTDWLLREGKEAVVPRLAQQLVLDLDEHKFAILTTERVRRPEHASLAHGAQIMEALSETVARVAEHVEALIVKGGITSAEVAVKGLGAHLARVQGQLQEGVALWELLLPDGRSLPYAVVPGNVGEERTLLEIAQKFQAAPLRPLTPLQPIEQRPLVAEITQRLLDYLLSGDLKPGSRLPSERQLSEALGMGRSTLRESLKALTLLGLLEVRQGDGTYLRRADSALLPRVIEWGLLLGEKRTMDLVEARLKIEVAIAELAAQRRDSFAVEELRQLLERMGAAGHDYQAFVDADVAFHLKLAEIARNSVLRDILSSIQALLRAWIIRVIQSAGDTDFSYREHLAIFTAVEQGDPGRAAAAMQAHMDSARSRLLAAIAQERSQRQTRKEE
ncbi:four-carbon acid sugar kinase family protein [Thermogemmatispora sp.]|uniref:four-carbon acid sugar kinase family protein n=1 Tax=Thermogemmatispora sp. TaxID=1968838 RepID=UPI0035E459F0